MNISGPVRVEPTRPITMSKRGTDSPRKTAIATIADLIMHRWTQKSVKQKTTVKIIRKLTSILPKTLIDLIDTKACRYKRFTISS